MINIRKYVELFDWKMISRWWEASKEIGPTRDMLSGSTYILEFNKTPALCVTLYLLNAKAFAIVENFIGNPEVDKKVRRELTPILLAHLEQQAREHGYNRLFCMGAKDKLKSYYQDLGFVKTLDNVTTFIKEIK